jgi:epoxyqueuosine reductase
MKKDHYKELIRTKALELGFFHFGVSKAEFLEEEAPKLTEWLNRNYNGKMAYMANHFDKRLDPRLLVDGAKTVISLLLNYYPANEINSDIKISKYAYGEDYHHVIKDKLFELMQFIGDEIGDVNGRVFVDSAPVMDKVWAKRSGLGWMGKNTNLIHPKNGSFFFIAELIIDLDLAPDDPIKDYCGTCTRCIDACPTDAIVEPYVVDGSKCISYLTIELKDQLLPDEFKGRMDNWAFGCDVCQDVCPWNRFSKATNEIKFIPNKLMLEMGAKDWLELREETFNELLKNSAIKRTALDGMIRNVRFLTDLP